MRLRTHHSRCKSALAPFRACRAGVYAAAYRGCATAGVTLARNPYPDGWIACQKLTAKLILASALADLTPIFRGVASRIRPLFCGGSGLPQRPVEINGRSSPT